MQESILAIALLFQKFDFKFVNPDYELTVKQTLTLKPRDLFMHAKLRPGIDVLTLQRDMLYSNGGGTSAATKSRAQNHGALVEKPQTLKPVLIFYGSNTGTCQGLADILKTTAPQYGFDATLQPLDAAKNNLPRETPIVLITSTMYEGQAPDNGAEFLKWLEDGKDLSLDGVTFAVFGCGSSEYHQFLLFSFCPCLHQAQTDFDNPRRLERHLSTYCYHDRPGDAQQWSPSIGIAGCGRRE